MRKVLLGLLLGCSVVGLAKQIPFGDALSAAQSLVQKKPNDARARFALGRILLVGYATSPETIDVDFDPKSGQITFPSTAAVQVKSVDGPPSEIAKEQLKDAVMHFLKATRSDANNALYAVASAWAHEQLAVHWKEVMAGESLGDIASAADAWAKVAAENRRAYSMAKDADVKNIGSVTPGPNAFPSVLAAQNLLRLGKAGSARVTDAEAQRLRSHVAKFVS